MDQSNPFTSLLSFGDTIMVICVLFCCRFHYSLISPTQSNQMDGWSPFFIPPYLTICAWISWALRVIGKTDNELVHISLVEYIWNPCLRMIKEAKLYDANRKKILEDWLYMTGDVKKKHYMCELQSKHTINN